MENSIDDHCLILGLNAYLQKKGIMCFEKYIKGFVVLIKLIIHSSGKPYYKDITGQTCQKMHPN